MRIPDYPAPPALDGTEQLPIWSGGQQCSIPVTTLLQFLSANTPAAVALRAALFAAMTADHLLTNFEVL